MCNLSRQPQKQAAIVIMVVVAAGWSDSTLCAQATMPPFSEQAKVTVIDGSLHEFLGVAGISGDRAVVVGEDQHPEVYVFERDSADRWHQAATLAIPVTHPGTFQFRAAISGDTVIVADAADDERAVNAGAAFVFVRRGKGHDVWHYAAKLTADDAQSLDYLGISVAISGDTAILGARVDRQEAFDDAAYVFVRTDRSGESWRQVAKLEGDPVFGDEFGSSVAIDGDVAVVGAPGPNVVHSPINGAAYVFSRNQGSPNAWGHVATLTPADRADYGFGHAVSVSGGTAVVGAPNDPPGLRGAAYVFERDERDWSRWHQVTKLTASDPRDGARFGWSVSIDRDVAAIGAENAPRLTGSGAVYAFARNQGGTNAWGEVQKMTPGDGKAAGFGFSTSISRDTIAAGAPFEEDERGVSVGSGYVFVSDIDGDGLRDGMDPCPRDPLNDVTGRCQRASAVHPVLDDLIAEDEVTSDTRRRRQIIRATFTNTSDTAIRNPFFAVTELTGGNVLLNADGRGGVGATLSPDVGDGVLSPGESMTVAFQIRLRTYDPFQFFVSVHGDPVP